MMALDQMAPRWPIPPQQIFSAWASVRAAQSGRHHLSAASIHKYRSVWESWLRHLALTETPWHEASAAQLCAFVANIKPRSSRQAGASTVSKARYFRAISAIYAQSELTAYECGFADYVNPMREAVAPDDAKSEASASSILVAHHWPALLQARPKAAHWSSVRDTAMLHLVLDAALTVGEIRGLRISEVQLDAHGAPHTLALRGRRPAQQREIPLGSQARSRLAEWLTTRATLATPTDHVFVSQKGLRAASAMAIWHNLNSLIEQALQATGDQALHHGPNVLRNAAMLNWLLQGMEPAQVARRAGLSTIRKTLRIAKAAGSQVEAAVQDAADKEIRPASPHPALVDD
jgi:integrase/recombinase XerC